MSDFETSAWSPGSAFSTFAAEVTNVGSLDVELHGELEIDLGRIRARLAEARANGLIADVDGSDDREPIPMILTCPACGERHVDQGEFATKPHHTHACQHCGLPWRPAIVATVGVRFLPGFKDDEQ